jgi:hypothetical protein
MPFTESRVLFVYGNHIIADETAPICVVVVYVFRPVRFVSCIPYL